MKHFRRNAILVCALGAALSLAWLLRRDGPGGPPPGRWRPLPAAPPAGELSEAQRALIAKLEAIGYLAGSTAGPPGAGVTVHDPKRAHPGLNLYTSGHAAEALLVDMEGRVLHRWSADFWDVWPASPVGRGHHGTLFWRRAHLGPDGTLVAIFEGLGILKLDRDSRVLWANALGAHHDLEVLPDGSVYTLSRVAHVVPRVDPQEPILEDFVSVLDAAGREIRRVSILAALENSKFAGLWRRSELRGRYLFHTNTLEVLDGRIAHREPAFAKGRVLISLRELNAIAVMDLETPTLVWARTGSFRRQHDPKVLPNGNLLLFDNQGLRGRSSLLELDPLHATVHWAYRGSPEEPFYSASCGAAQRLPNGNTLATESDRGRAFEVTPEGEIVWEFVSPHRAGAEGEYIATLFEMVRLPADFPTGWIHSAPAAASAQPRQSADAH